VKAAPPALVVRRWLARPVVAGLVLLAAYVALSFAMSPRGYLGTDTGGKVATLEVMTHHGGGLDPDIGYWAEQWDPSGRFHGLTFTYRYGDSFLNASTLPMIYGTLPLYAIGGYRLALLFPMLGAVGAAFGARAISRRIGGGDGWAAYWVAGLASPLAIYALDLWEHSIGVALMVAGIVVLVDAVRVRATWWRGLLAGLAFGAAFSMRTESLAYGFVATAVVCAVLLQRDRSLRRPLVVGGASALGLVVVFCANAALEIAVAGTTFRAGRATGAASAGASSLGVRFDEAMTTAGSLVPSTDRGGFIVVVGLIGLLAYVAVRATRGGDQRLAYLAAGAAALLYLLRVRQGLGFVPGMVATTPFAVAGLALAWKRPTARIFALIAVCSLPFIWLFDFAGGAAPQWGGRYILVSGLILGTIGITLLADRARWARTFFLVLAVGITGFGLMWMSQRTHEVARAGEWIAARPEPVVVSNVPFWLRESGSYEPGRRWLSVDQPGEAAIGRAAQIVTDAGIDQFGLITFDEPGAPSPSVPGYRAGAQEIQHWLGVDFRYTVYDRSP
jgi:hypothetical protein